MLILLKCIWVNCYIFKKKYAHECVAFVSHCTELEAKIKLNYKPTKVKIILMAHNLKIIHWCSNS